jgi:lysophospholipase L1-like esterase
VQKNRAGDGGTLTRQKTALFAGVSALVVIVVLAFVSEGVLRLVGVKPWESTKKTTRVEPGGRFFETNAALGYTHIPGAYTVTLADGYSFQVTHLPNTLRITHAIEPDDSTRGKDGIWIFGCSFTYGWAINDNQAYAWLLQEEFPDYEVVNFGCSGYGTLHSLIQLREALAKHKPPKAVVLAYASFHDARNTFLRKRRKSVAPWNSLGPLVQPYADFDSDGKLVIQMADVEYREFPLMRRSSLAHFIEMTYNNIEAVRTPSRRISEAIVDEMLALCQANDIPMVFAFIDGKPYMMDHARKLGIPIVDMSVDLSIPANTNLPHDGHPSAVAHRQYADTLTPMLREILLDPKAKS